MSSVKMAADLVQQGLTYTWNLLNAPSFCYLTTLLLEALFRVTNLIHKNPMFIAL